MLRARCLSFILSAHLRLCDLLHDNIALSANFNILHSEERFDMAGVPQEERPAEPAVAGISFIRAGCPNSGIEPLRDELLVIAGR